MTRLEARARAAHRLEHGSRIRAIACSRARRSHLAYFANGYACRAGRSPSCVIAWTTHESDRFPPRCAAATRSDVQFHPEKSSRAGSGTARGPGRRPRRRRFVAGARPRRPRDDRDPGGRPARRAPVCSSWAVATTTSASASPIRRGGARLGARGLHRACTSSTSTPPPARGANAERDRRDPRRAGNRDRRSAAACATADAIERLLAAARGASWWARGRSRTGRGSRRWRATSRPADRGGRRARGARVVTHGWIARDRDATCSTSSPRSTACRSPAVAGHRGRPRGPHGGRRPRR